MSADKPAPSRDENLSRFVQPDLLNSISTSSLMVTRRSLPRLRGSLSSLSKIVEAIGGARLKRIYNPSAPTGVRGRNSDNTLIAEHLGWAPGISLEIGLARTYRWIYD
jgi:hypothetical protein